MPGLLLSPQEDLDTKASQAVSTLQPLPWEYLVAWGKPGRLGTGCPFSACLSAPSQGSFRPRHVNVLGLFSPPVKRAALPSPVGSYTRPLCCPAEVVTPPSSPHAQAAVVKCPTSSREQQKHRSKPEHLWSQGHSKVISPAAW